MMELIRQSAVPANIMRSASRGALALPAPEMIEILVFLTASPIFGEQARMTLAGWDESACKAVCFNPATPLEVLNYFVAPQNRRPRLVPVLLENPSVPDEALVRMAQEPSPEMIALLLAGKRAMKCTAVLHALGSNPALTAVQHKQVNDALLAAGEFVAVSEPDEADAILEQYKREHAHEIAAEEGKAFELVGSSSEEATAAAATAAPAAPAAAAAPKHEEERERLSTVQKIARLTVGDRVQLAMKGTKDERFVLIRDGSKVVSSAVLESPKLSEQEVETFASMKNVQESVLRGIAGKRKMIKNYSVVRNLANNPRCPLDIQLTLVKNLLTQDLRSLSMNKNISETVRKLALKAFKERTEKKGGG